MIIVTTVEKMIIQLQNREGRAEDCGSDSQTGSQEPPGSVRFCTHGAVAPVTKADVALPEPA